MNIDPNYDWPKVINIPGIKKVTLDLFTWPINFKNLPVAIFNKNHKLVNNNILSWNDDGEGSRISLG